MGHRCCCCLKEICISLLTQRARHYNKGVKGRGYAPTHCVTWYFQLSLKRRSLFVWWSQQWEEWRDKRDKAPTKFLIIAAGWWLPPSPLPRFFCLRKLHKFNNSIVRNYFPPHYESFVKRLNFHLPAVAFEQNSTVWWWLSQPGSAEAAAIVSTSINTHLKLKLKMPPQKCIL